MGIIKLDEHTKQCLGPGAYLVVNKLCFLLLLFFNSFGGPRRRCDALEFQEVTMGQRARRRGVLGIYEPGWIGEQRGPRA